MERKITRTIPEFVEGSTGRLDLIDKILRIFENKDGLKPSDLEQSERREIKRASRFLDN